MCQNRFFLKSSFHIVLVIYRNFFKEANFMEVCSELTEFRHRSVTFLKYRRRFSKSCLRFFFYIVFNFVKYVDETYRRIENNRVAEKRENSRFDSRQRSTIFLMLSSTIPN